MHKAFLRTGETAARQILLLSEPFQYRYRYPRRKERERQKKQTQKLAQFSVAYPT